MTLSGHPSRPAAHTPTKAPLPTAAAVVGVQPTPKPTVRHTVRDRQAASGSGGNGGDAIVAAENLVESVVFGLVAAGLPLPKPLSPVDQTPAHAPTTGANAQTPTKEATATQAPATVAPTATSAPAPAAASASAVSQSKPPGAPSTPATGTPATQAPSSTTTPSAQKFSSLADSMAEVEAASAPAAAAPSSPAKNHLSVPGAVAATQPPAGTTSTAASSPSVSPVPSTGPASASAASQNTISNDFDDKDEPAEDALTPGNPARAAHMALEPEERRKIELDELKKRGFEEQELTAHELNKVSGTPDQKKLIGAWCVRMECKDKAKRKAYDDNLVKTNNHSTLAASLAQLVTIYSCRCEKVGYQAKRRTIDHITKKHPLHSSPSNPNGDLQNILPQPQQLLPQQKSEFPGKEEAAGLLAGLSQKAAVTSTSAPMAITTPNPTASAGRPSLVKEDEPMPDAAHVGAAAAALSSPTASSGMPHLEARYPGAATGAASSSAVSAPFNVPTDTSSSSDVSSLTPDEEKLLSKASQELLAIDVLDSAPKVLLRFQNELRAVYRRMHTIDKQVGFLYPRYQAQADELEACKKKMQQLQEEVDCLIYGSTALKRIGQEVEVAEKKFAAMREQIRVKQEADLDKQEHHLRAEKNRADLAAIWMRKGVLVEKKTGLTPGAVSTAMQDVARPATTGTKRGSDSLESIDPPSAKRRADVAGSSAPPPASGVARSTGMLTPADRWLQRPGKGVVQSKAMDELMRLENAEDIQHQMLTLYLRISTQKPHERYYHCEIVGDLPNARKVAVIYFDLLKELGVLAEKARVKEILDGTNVADLLNSALLDAEVPEVLVLSSHHLDSKAEGAGEQAVQIAMRANPSLICAFLTPPGRPTPRWLSVVAPYRHHFSFGPLPPTRWDPFEVQKEGNMLRELASRHAQAKPKTCAICQDLIVEFVYQPCGHAACCADCDRALQESGGDHESLCPVCRQPIASRIRIGGAHPKPPPRAPVASGTDKPQLSKEEQAAKLQAAMSKFPMTMPAGSAIKPPIVTSPAIRKEPTSAPMELGH
jgi:hypothetical protein